MVQNTRDPASAQVTDTQADRKKQEQGSTEEQVAERQTPRQGWHRCVDSTIHTTGNLRGTFYSVDETEDQSPRGSISRNPEHAGPRRGGTAGM